MTGTDQKMETLDRGDTVPDTGMPASLFHTGRLYDAWNFLGAHGGPGEDGTYRYIFRVWAPDAAAISLTGRPACRCSEAMMKKYGNCRWRQIPI